MKEKELDWIRNNLVKEKYSLDKRERAQLKEKELDWMRKNLVKKKIGLIEM